MESEGGVGPTMMGRIGVPPGSEMTSNCCRKAIFVVVAGVTVWMIRPAPAQEHPKVSFRQELHDHVIVHLTLKQARRIYSLLREINRVWGRMDADISPDAGGCVSVSMAWPNDGRPHPNIDFYMPILRPDGSDILDKNVLRNSRRKDRR